MWYNIFVIDLNNFLYSHYTWTRIYKMSPDGSYSKTKAKRYVIYMRHLIKYTNHNSAVYLIFDYLEMSYVAFTI